MSTSSAVVFAAASTAALVLARTRATASASATANATEPGKLRRSDYVLPAFLVPTVSLDFALDPDSTTVRAALSVQRAPGTHGTADLVLHGEDLALLEVAVGGRTLLKGEYTVEADGSLRLPTAALPSGPGAFEVRTVVEINPRANTALEGLYYSSSNFVTQCEAEGFRRIAFSLDRPDVMSAYTVRHSSLSGTFSSRRPMNSPRSAQGTSSLTPP